MQPGRMNVEFVIFITAHSSIYPFIRFKNTYSWNIEFVAKTLSEENEYFQSVTGFF